MLALFITNKIEHCNSEVNGQKIINLLNFKIKTETGCIEVNEAINTA